MYWENIVSEIEFFIQTLEREGRTEALYVGGPSLLGILSRKAVKTYSKKGEQIGSSYDQTHQICQHTTKQSYLEEDGPWNTY